MTSGNEIRHNCRDVAEGGGSGFSCESSESVVCSVCLDEVVNDGKRSWAKLQCGHVFHLDCIGSAFNRKGSMQCPNCRKTEEGRWLYASDSGADDEFLMVDLSRDEDIYNLNYSEAVLEALWCPPFEETDALRFSNSRNHSSPITDADLPRSTGPQLGQSVSASHPLTRYSLEEFRIPQEQTRACDRVEIVVEVATAATAADQQWSSTWRPTMQTSSSYVPLYVPPLAPYPYSIESREALRDFIPPFPVSLSFNTELLEAFWLETETERQEWPNRFL